MKLEIVTHCYAERIPEYAAALCYHLSPFTRYKGPHQIRVTICSVRTDELVNKVLEHFFPLIDKSPNRRLSMIQMATVGHVGRRCIGRNEAALHTKADVVWFCDVDHVITDLCVDSLGDLVENWPEGASMIYPRELFIHKDHVTGDAALNQFTTPREAWIDPTEFIIKSYNRAIGGVQIVRGDFARGNGYLNNHPHYQEPRTDDRPFADFRDDIEYRRFCSALGPIVRVDLPGLYRIRHLEKTHAG